MTSDSEPSDLLEVNGVLRQRWRVIRKLGRGGFGEIYEAVDILTDEKLAIKVESGRQPKQVLKMELAVLKKLQCKDHVCQLYGSGRTNYVNFIVMTLLGRSLGELRRSQPKSVFTISTGLRIIYQIIEAVEAIHSVGFLHRDIKPSNFAMGAGPHNSRKVYMIDFGLSRQYVDMDNNIRPPRDEAGFRGTIRYASVTAHLNHEMARHDDLWSVFYVLVEFITAQLPWRKIKDKEEVGRMKQNFNHDALLANLPHEFKGFLRHIQSLGYYDKPDYELLRNIIERCKNRKHMFSSDPYDWETERPISNNQEYPQTVEAPTGVAGNKFRRKPSSKTEIQASNSAIPIELKPLPKPPPTARRLLNTDKVSHTTAAPPTLCDEVRLSRHSFRRESNSSQPPEHPPTDNSLPLPGESLLLSKGAGPASLSADGGMGCSIDPPIIQHHQEVRQSPQEEALPHPHQTIDQLLDEAILYARDEMLDQLADQAQSDGHQVLPSSQIIPPPPPSPLAPVARDRPSKAPHGSSSASFVSSSSSSASHTPPDCPKIEVAADSPYALQISTSSGDPRYNNYYSQVQKQQILAMQNSKYHHPVVMKPCPITERGEMPVPKPRWTLRPRTTRSRIPVASKVSGDK